MKDTQPQDKNAPESPAGGTGNPPSAEPPASDRDEAAPGTPGTGENIDPQTGQTFIEGIGGA